MEPQSTSGIVTRLSVHSVDETVGRIRALLEQRHITLFALIDHSGEAAQVGLAMPATKLLIFGNPKGGTPLMLESPSSAIDLPLKLLVAEDAAGMVRISYNDPKYLGGRHHISKDLLANIGVVAALADQAGAA
jgi:uncharacterized protein (DUF302 family)